MSAAGVATLTYSPDPDKSVVAAPEDLERLVQTARGLHQLAGDRPLYESATVDSGSVVFTVRLDPWPTIGALNLARGLVNRAMSEACTPGELVEKSATRTSD